MHAVIHIQTSNFWITYLYFYTAGIWLWTMIEWLVGESEIKKMLDDHLVQKNYVVYIQSSQN